MPAGVTPPFGRRGLGPAVLLLLLAGFGPARALEPATAVDGDTIRARGQSVRVIGLDAPEIRGRCRAEKRLALRARDRMAALVRGGVTMQVRGRPVDRYGRPLRVVRDSRGRDVAEVMIAEGLARPYHGERRRGWCGWFGRLRR